MNDKNREIENLNREDLDVESLTPEDLEQVSGGGCTDYGGDCTTFDSCTGYTGTCTTFKKEAEEA
jgi:hypothetical protein